MKKKISILFVLMALLVLTMIPVSAKSKTTSGKAKAMKAYQKELKKLRNYKDCKFALVYLNKDKTPELFVSYNQPCNYKDFGPNGNVITVAGYTNYTTTYTFSKNKIKVVSTQTRTGKPDNVYYYFKNTGVFKSVRTDSMRTVTNHFNMTQKALKIGNNNITRMVTEDYLYNDKSHSCYKVDNTTNDGRLALSSIKESDFNAYIKKITKGKKASKVNFIKNTDKNAKKKCK